MTLKMFRKVELTFLRTRRPPRRETARTHSARSRVHVSQGGSPELPLQVVRIDDYDVSNDLQVAFRFTLSASQTSSGDARLWLSARLHLVESAWAPLGSNTPQLDSKVPSGIGSRSGGTLIRDVWRLFAFSG